MPGQQRDLRVVISGDSTGVRRALGETDAALAQTSARVEGFGAAFTKLGAVLGGAALLKEGASAVFDYSKELESAEARIIGFTGSQAALARAQAAANQEVARGRGTYGETLATLADLTPMINKYNLSQQDVLHTAQLLAAIDPAQGMAGAQVALREALSGDFTSLVERFELPRASIQALKDQGVPNLQIVQRALADLGIDEKLLDAQAGTTAQQQKILTDSLLKLASEAAKPILTGINGDIKSFNAQLQDSDSWLHKLGEILKAYGDALDAVGAKAGSAGAEIALGFLKMLQAIPNDRGANDPIGKWLEGQIANRERLLAEAAEKAKAGATKVPEATTTGLKPTATQTTAATGYGSSLLAAYIKGLDPAGQAIFGDLQKIVQDSLKAASPDGKVDDTKLRGVMPLIAQIADEIARTGTVSEDTWGKVQVALGGESPEIRTLIADYGALADAKTKVVAATEGLKAAEAALKRDSADAAREERELGAAVALSQRNQAAADKAEAANIRGLQEAHKGLGDQQKQAAADGVAALVPLHAELKATQAAGAAVAAGYQAQNEAIQRQIDLNNELVGALEHQRDVKFLAIDERLAEIGKSRDANDLREAATLRRERAKIERDSKPQIALERERAQVANYGLQQQQQGIQDAAKAQAASSAAAVAGVQAQIDKQTEASAPPAAGGPARRAAPHKVNDGATEDARSRHDADQERIDAQQQLASDTKTFWDDRKAADQQAVDNARDIETAAKGTQTAAEGTLAAWQQTIAALAAAGLIGKRPEDQKPTIDENPGGDQAVANEIGIASGATGGAAVGGGRDAREDGSAASGAIGAGTTVNPAMPNTGQIADPTGQPSDYAGPGPNPLLYLGKDGQLHPYAPGGGGGYQIPDGNSGATGGGSSFGASAPQAVQINAYGVGEAELLNRLAAAVQRVAQS